MFRKAVVNPRLVPIVLILQLVPLLALPPSSFSTKSQEWWLPVLLSLLAVFALVQILVRRSAAFWPWFLVAFAQGISIISRLMMLMPHTTKNVNGVQRFDTLYVLLSLGSMVSSAFVIWYSELPEVRNSFLGRSPSTRPS